MIPERKLEAINHRMTNNTMAKREGTKGQTMIYKSLYRKRDKNKDNVMHVDLLIE